MSLERHARGREIFLGSCELSTEERSAYLNKVCGDDEELRHEVESLLEFHDEPGGTGSTSASTRSEIAGAAPLSRETVPGYRILQRIGEGGMGVVYAAEQLEPLRRKVALKVIKVGMDTSQVVARFDSERQALARMDHPNIARILDAGVTGRGRPFFAMEFIGGERITAYCDRQRLNTTERLELFTKVCDAIQHAHRKGIIHRDIKPSNVMVRLLDGRPVPTVIDFGIAKATQHRLTAESMHTAMGMMIGTPEYMSPEQAAMSGDVDTRTDVYSLGVLLYELLVGSLPFDSTKLQDGDLEETRRQIREEEPSRPSTRVATLGDAANDTAERRQTDPPGLSRELRGDLDWITLRALEKDRSRRYGSPSELSADIARHLRDQPVVASPPNTVYRIRKFVRRHRVGVMAGGAVALALILGLALATAGVFRALRAERAATLEAAKANKVSELLMGLFDDLNRGIPGHVMTVEQILDRGLQRVEEELADEPVLQARLMGYLGGSYGSLGRTERAFELVDRSVALLREHLPPDHPLLAAGVSLLGDMMNASGDLPRAERLHEEALAIWERNLGPEGTSISLGRTLKTLGSIRLQSGDFSKARWYLDRSRKVLERHPGVYPMHLAYTLYWQAILDSDAELDHESALARLERALAILESEFGQGHPQTWNVLTWLGRIHYRRDDTDAAQEHFERALSLQQGMPEQDNAGQAIAMTGLGQVLASRGKLEEARALLERAFAIFEENGGTLSPDAAWCARCLAGVYRRTGDLERARQLLERGLEELERGLGTEHPGLTRTLHHLAYLEYEAGNLERSQRIYRRALEIQGKAWSPGHRVNGRTLYQLACIAALEGRPEQALDLLRNSVGCGFDREVMLEDADLVSLRGTPEFDAIVADGLRR